jgi:hypothetical protein
VKKLDAMIARLRFLIADASAKQARFSQLRRQLHDQSERLLTYSLYGDADLDRDLALMRDVAERARQAEMDEAHLTRIRERAERELESLLLTKAVEDAKAQLGRLYERKSQIEHNLARVAGPGAVQVDLAAAADLKEIEAGLASEIRRLQQDINEASERAARSLETSSR